MKTKIPLSVAKTAIAFLTILPVMEAAAAFAASQSGDWTVFFFTQPACFATALVTGTWLGLMASDTDEAPERVAVARKRRRGVTPANLASLTGTSA